MIKNKETRNLSQSRTHLASVCSSKNHWILINDSDQWWSSDSSLAEGWGTKLILFSVRDRNLPDRPAITISQIHGNVDVTTHNWQRGAASNLHTPNHCCFTRGSCDCWFSSAFNFSPYGLCFASASMRVCVCVLCFSSTSLAILLFILHFRRSFIYPAIPFFFFFWIVRYDFPSVGSWLKNCSSISFCWTNRNEIFFFWSCCWTITFRTENIEDRTIFLRIVISASFSLAILQGHSEIFVAKNSQWNVCQRYTWRFLSNGSWFINC